MISIAVIQFLFYLSLPWIIGKAFSYISKAGKKKSSKLDGDSHDQESKTLSLKERFIYATVIMFLVHYIWFCFGGAPLNFFQITDTPTNAPGFQLRENYKSYLQKMSESNPEFEKAMKKLGDTPSRADEDDIRMFRARRYSNVYSIFGYYINPEAIDQKGQETEHGPDAPPYYLTEEEILYEKYQYIFDRLKSPAKRTIYLKYGEEAFLDCHFCQDDFDYLYFIGPLVMSSYVCFMIAGGILTILKRKSKWRNIYILFCGVLAICELFYYIAPNEMSSLDIYAYLFPTEEKASTYQKLEIVRKLFFAAALLIGLLFDNGHKRSENDMINDMNSSIEESIAIQQTSKLQKLAMMYDNSLRKFYIEHYEKSEKTWNNEEFNKKSSDIMKKYDIDSMTRTASELVDGIVDEYVEKSQDTSKPTQLVPKSRHKEDDKQQLNNESSILSEMYED